MVVRIAFIFILFATLSGRYVQFGGGIFKDAQDAQSEAMGGIGINVAGSGNPALLIHANESSVHFSQKDKYGGLSKVGSVSYFHFGRDKKNQTPIYFQIINRSVQNIPDTRSAWLDDGNSVPEAGEINYFNIGNFTQNEIGVKTAFIHRFNSIIVGTSLKPWFTQLDNDKAFGFSADISTLTQFFENKLNISLRIEDLFTINRWTTGRNESIIPEIIAGGHFQGGPIQFGVELQSSLIEDPPFNYNIGFEFHQKGEIVIIRGGTSYNHLFTAGLGLNFNMLQIDYAYLHTWKNSPFDPSQIVSIGIFLEKAAWIKGKITP